jgi:class 3 adenylate cyclase/predicted negative regulator of RcsB-dependent stress response
MRWREDAGREVDMMARVKQVLEQAGVAADDVDALASLVVAPPPGTIDVAELTGADDGKLALLVAIVAAINTRRFSKALKCLLAFVGARETALSDYDSGRFWHLKGVVAWRLDEGLYPATRALNRSVRLLQSCDAPQAQGYLVRVFDTSGQMLQHQGLLREARVEFTQVLHMRQDVHDQVGEALTLGNLGRLCMELGDFAEAAEHLTRDLAIVEQVSPEQTRIRAQLLSHLGTCAVEQSKMQAAQDHFRRSAELAQADHDPPGLAFAALGLGRVALQGDALALAERHADEAGVHLASLATLLDDQEGTHEGIRGLMHQLKAEIHLARANTAQAIEAFKAAHACFSRTPRKSVVEMARLLYGYAKARLANGEEQDAASLLRKALWHLDASTAETLRQEIEAMMRTHFPESWFLHTTGRFIGQQYMDFLLEHAGQSAFRGEQQDVVTLFSDIRDFTTLSERFRAQPETFVKILNDYLGYMTRCVEHFKGIVIQFSGDGVMAVFSLSNPQPNDPERAVLAALMMQEELERFHRTLPQDMPRFVVGVGLHTGPVIAGLFGSPQKRLYTVNGDAVNTAARLEGLTKHLGASILISEEVKQSLPHPERFLLRPLGRYRLKGKKEVVAVLDVMGEDDGSRFAQALQEEIAQTRVALEHFRQGQFQEASATFTELVTMVEQTGHKHRAKGYSFLTSAAEAYRKAPPPDQWDGAVTMDEK